MSELLAPAQLHNYQKEMVLHQLFHDDSMLWAQMGLGKSIVTLTTIVDRMRAGQVQKTLIFGPLRVIQAVWAREARKWSHTKHLRFSVIHGTKEKRLRALFADVDVYLINYENMNWLSETLMHYYLSQGKPLPFQMVVYDEVSKMKNSTSLRMAGGNRDRKDRRGETYKIKVTGWRKIIPHFKYRTGLTGTPASNGYLDLHGQYLAVDNGKRLGEYITQYKDRCFASDYMGWSYSPTEFGKQWIEQQISDITIKMDAKDYLDMPAVKIVNMMVDLPDNVRKAYKDIENDLFTRLESGKEVEVFSKSSVSNKCLQFCNGSPYLSSESPDFEAVHDAKLDALEEVLEEAAGSPVLCSYTFKADAERIMAKFKKLNPVNLTTTPSKDTEKVINKWNNGEIRLLIGHPACLGADTLVLTERNGWVRITDVRNDDRVHDSVEFVSHSGCQFSGVKPVIDVFGMTMTPDHKLLIGGKWVEAQDVEDSEDTRTSARTQEVYDLVNCGPRHRFLIRNPDGEVFISHNSMGHGVDGLQQSGSIMVWFGLNWSLELYDQMCGRLNRQGQTRAVSIIRILCRDTIDLAVADAIERKTDDQDGLKAALQRYRDGVTTNDLTVNFF